MKKVLLNLAGLIMLGALLSSSTVLTKPATTKGATPFHMSSTDPLVMQFYNDCTGDWMDVTGNVHTMINGVINNNKVSGTMHINYSGVSGTGSSGKTYSGSGGSNLMFNMPINGSFVSGENTVVVRMTTAGGGNNFTLRVVHRFVVNSNGTVTVGKDLETTSCK